MRLRPYVCLLGMIAAATGCVREIDTLDEPAEVTSVGPIATDDADNVVVSYTLRDFEGDDQTVRVEVCTVDGEECGPAVQAPGGDPTTRVPTVPENTDVLHTFHWNPWCGRYVETDLVGSEIDAQYIVSIEVLGTETGPVTSEPFTLESVGLVSAGDCE